MRKPRLLASLLCAVLMVGVLTVPAYAGGGDESEDGVGEYVPWEGLEPAEPLPTEPNPFTPDGTGTVVDNATDQDGKEFFTITTAEEAVFYLVIDRQRETENVYFLNAVTVADLMALAESSGEPAAPEPPPEPEPEPTTTPEPEPVPEKKGGAGPLLLALAVVVIGGGAGWYFKIYRPKLQKAAEPEEDYGGDPYDGPEDYDGEAPWDEEPEE
nr:DUF4366 domain-containing protein [uncultured Oscillibacter sp.]